MVLLNVRYAKEEPDSDDDPEFQMQWAKPDKDDAVEDAGADVAAVKKEAEVDAAVCSGSSCGIKNQAITPFVLKVLFILNLSSPLSAP